ncbi:acetylcholinesterase-like [Tubulanus polymorphus]|uniref:acetylcholinesterase-like n=1 Tax=Tubulanus polymorphus TaxID=672921 RepID=UPI003DA6A9D2
MLRAVILYTACLIAGVASQEDNIWNPWDPKIQNPDLRPWRPGDKMDVGSMWQNWLDWGKGDVNFLYNPNSNYNHMSVVTEYGDIHGYTVNVGHPHTRVNTYLGVPYAMPPIGYYRFRPPAKTRWYRPWQAKKWPPACPQDPAYLQKHLINKVNISEDCLYLNIFQPNISTREYPFHPVNPRFPIIVYFHGGEFNYGSGQLFPGYYLATREVILVTVNYRLGPFGFLSTQDENAKGNFGLLDQLAALEFVRDIAEYLRADETKITIMGSEAGGISVGLHMVSPRSRSRGLFQAAIAIDGSDLCENSYTSQFWKPEKYAEQLGCMLNCPCKPEQHWEMLRCLRDKPVDEILSAGSKISPGNGRGGFAWTPVWDGSYEFMPTSPGYARANGRFEKIPYMAGLTRYGAAQLAAKYLGDSPYGLTKAGFREHTRRLLNEWSIENTDEVLDLLEYKYTYWPDPHNDTIRRLNFTDMLTDKKYGSCVDAALKHQARFDNRTYFYVFDYVSGNSTNPEWMGAYAGEELPWLYGAPWFNYTLWNDTNDLGLVHQTNFSDLDKNISNYMMFMLTNFSKLWDPTPEKLNETYFYSYNLKNLTYINIGYPNLTNQIAYRQSYYGFWNHYFRHYARIDNEWIIPEAAMLEKEYYMTTYVLAAGTFVLLTIAMCMCCLFVRRSRREKREPPRPPERSYPPRSPTSYIHSNSNIFDAHAYDGFEMDRRTEFSYA